MNFDNSMPDKIPIWQISLYVHCTSFLVRSGNGTWKYLLNSVVHLFKPQWCNSITWAIVDNDCLSFYFWKRVTQAYPLCSSEGCKAAIFIYKYARYLLYALAFSLRACFAWASVWTSDWITIIFEVIQNFLRSRSTCLKSKSGAWNHMVVNKQKRCIWIRLYANTCEIWMCFLNKM